MKEDYDKDTRYLLKKKEKKKEIKEEFEDTKGVIKNP